MHLFTISKQATQDYRVSIYALFALKSLVKYEKYGTLSTYTKKEQLETEERKTRACS